MLKAPRLWAPPGLDIASNVTPHTGTPGIGKSCFKFALMHWLLSSKLTETIVVEEQSMRLLFKVGSQVLRGTTGAFESELVNPTTW